MSSQAPWGGATRGNVEIVRGRFLSRRDVLKDDESPATSERVLPACICQHPDKRRYNCIVAVTANAMDGISIVRGRVMVRFNP